MLGLSFAAVTVSAATAVAAPRPINVVNGMCPVSAGYMQQGNKCVPVQNNAKEVFIKSNHASRCPSGWTNAFHWCIAPY